MPLTSKLVLDFYADAAKKFGAEYKNKNDSEFMKLVAKFLDSLNILKKEDFLNEFTTTIGTIIYTPFELGVDGSSGYDLWNQVSVLVHELVHVCQFKKNPAEFTILYIADKSDRATYESQAYGADLEMHWWMYGKGYDLKRRAQSLLSYGLSQEYCDYMEQFLATYNDVFQQGGSVSEVAKWAKEWLTEHGAK